MSNSIIFKKKLSKKEKIAYGFGDLASNFIYTSLSMYILFFWTDVVGIAAITAGNILLISKIWDGINDPIMGWFIDRSNFKGGKAKPFIKWLCVPFGISAVICFITPESSMIVKIIYAFLSYNLTNMIYTAINIPYGILATKMTSDVEERGSLNVYRMLFAMIGVAIVGFLAPLLVSNFGFVVTFSFLGFVGTLMWIYLYKNTEEIPDLNEAESEKLEFGLGIKLLFKNKIWIILTAGMLLNCMGNAFTSTSAIYFISYVMQRTDLVGLFITIPTIAQIISLFILTPTLFHKYGKIKTAQYSLILGSLADIGIFMFVRNENQLLLLAILLFIQGFCLAPIMSATFAMLSDSIEYGEWKNGRRVEGLTYAGASLGLKIGAGLGAAIVGYALALVGYQPNTIQSANAILGIRSMYVLAPVLCFLLYAFILKFNEVDKIYPQIERELVMRKGEYDE